MFQTHRCELRADQLEWLAMQAEDNGVDIDKMLRIMLDAMMGGDSAVEFRRDTVSLWRWKWKDEVAKDGSRTMPVAAPPERASFARLQQEQQAATRELPPPIRPLYPERERAVSAAREPSIHRFRRPDEDLTVPGFRLICRSGRVVIGTQKPVSLTQTEASVLAVLMLANGQTLSRQKITDTIWGAHDLDTRAVDAHIYRLRRKMDPATVIQTDRDFGYCFVFDAEVEAATFDGPDGEDHLREGLDLMKADG